MLGWKKIHSIAVKIKASLRLVPLRNAGLGLDFDPHFVSSKPPSKKMK